MTVADTDLAEAEGFGEGFAPFFIPLALFVGALITWLLMRPLPSRALATPPRDCGPRSPDSCRHCASGSRRSP
ncbi:hypothetical protein NKG05_10590 [Oerskovia sp. M15]